MQEVRSPNTAQESCIGEALRLPLLFYAGCGGSTTLLVCRQIGNLSPRPFGSRLAGIEVGCQDKRKTRATKSFFFVGRGTVLNLKW